MRPILVTPVAVLLSSFPVMAQNIDLARWTAEHINTVTIGTWTTNAPRLSTTFNGGGTVNDCSVFYSDFSVGVLDFRIRVDPAAGDDDYFGFVLGFNPGDASNPSSDYLLIDWKKLTQTYSNWGTANMGLALSRVTGVPTPGTSGGPIDLWSHTGVAATLARGTVSGSTGWVHGTNYNFRVIFTGGSVDIWLNGQQEFHLTGTFKPGRFGCYDFSQNQTEFQFPVQGSFTPFGTACQGSVGKPSLVSPGTPWIGETFQMVLTNLPSVGATILLLGGSNTTWQGIPLPFNLGLVGGTGCTLYVSGDVTLPVTNTGGTAFINIPIPNTLLPTLVPIYLQGVALDAGANSLGMVFSNAATAAIGIH